MLVKDILESKKRDLITVGREDKIAQAMDLLINNTVSCLPVLADNELCGIISDKDIFRKAHSDPTGFTGVTVGDIMTVDLIVGLADDDIGYIAGVMTKNHIRHIPIVEGRNLVGLISVGDIVKTSMQKIEIENRFLKEYIDGSYPR